MKPDLIYLLLSIVLSAVGQLVLKYGVVEMGGIDIKLKNIISSLVQVFTNGWVMIGVLCFVTSMILWLKVISTMELSRAYPSVSLSYVIVFIFSLLLFKEGASASKIMGLISIMVGVFLLQR